MQFSLPKQDGDVPEKAAEFSELRNTPWREKAKDQDDMVHRGYGELHTKWRKQKWHLPHDQSVMINNLYIINFHWQYLVN